MAVTADARRIEKWIADGTRESQRLDIKRELNLSSRSDKIELLRDLTAMGNGGGGTLVFGIAEGDDGSSRAQEVSPLNERGLAERIRDLTSAAVHPPLEWAYAEVPFDEGYVLIVDVEPSRLGPYMIQELGESRYWIRLGDHKVKMTERLVHDAYARSARRQTADHERWEQLHLPLPPAWPSSPYIRVSALPDLEQQVIDPVHVDRSTLRAASSAHATSCGLDTLTQALAIWSDGFVATGPAAGDPGTRYSQQDQAALRIHRNGAVGLRQHIVTSSELDPSRTANAFLNYVGSLWTTFGIRSGLVRIEYTGFGKRASNEPPPTGRVPPSNQGVPWTEARLDLTARAADLVSAAPRHRIVRQFADRVANMFGQRQATLGFEVGQLYEASGRAAFTAYPGRLHQDGPHGLHLTICSDGLVSKPETSSPCGWWLNGLFIDLHGNAVAGLEFPTAEHVPSGYQACDPTDRPITDGDFSHRPDPPPHDRRRPAVTGLWIQTSMLDFFRALPSV